MVVFFFTLIVFFIGYHVWSNWKKEVKVDMVTKQKTVSVYYEKYCWKCGPSETIDSRLNKLCQKCHKYYKCNKCHNCLCDRNNTYKKSKKTGSEWRMVSKSFNLKHKYGHCNNCGDELQGNKSMPLCYTCWKAQKSKTHHKYGHCTRCGKELRGDRSKKLCYSCWKASPTI